MELWLSVKQLQLIVSRVTFDGTLVISLLLPGLSRHGN